MCLFIMLCGLPRLVVVAVRCTAVRRPTNNSPAQAQVDVDRSEILSFIIILYFNFKYLKFMFKYYLILNYKCCSVKAVLFWRLAFICYVIL